MLFLVYKRHPRVYADYNNLSKTAYLNNTRTRCAVRGLASLRVGHTHEQGMCVCEKELRLRLLNLTMRNYLSFLPNGAFHYASATALSSG